MYQYDFDTVLYKDAETLQKAKDVNCVLLDKTATLTVGQPTVTDFQCFAIEKWDQIIAVVSRNRIFYKFAEAVFSAEIQSFGNMFPDDIAALTRRKFIMFSRTVNIVFNEISGIAQFADVME